MNVTEKITHAAERKAFETMLDTIIKKSQTQDVGELFESLVNMVQKIHGSVWSPETFDTLRKISEDPIGPRRNFRQPRRGGAPSPPVPPDLLPLPITP